MREVSQECPEERGKIRMVLDGRNLGHREGERACNYICLVTCIGKDTQALIRKHFIGSVRLLNTRVSFARPITKVFICQVIVL